MPLKMSEARIGFCLSVHPGPPTTPLTVTRQPGSGFVSGRSHELLLVHLFDAQAGLRTVHQHLAGAVGAEVETGEGGRSERQARPRGGEGGGQGRW